MKKRIITSAIITLLCVAYVVGAWIWLLQPMHGIMIHFLGEATPDKMCEMVYGQSRFRLVDPARLDAPSVDLIIPMWQAHELRARALVALCVPCLAFLIALLKPHSKETDNNDLNPIENGAPFSKG